MYTSLYSRHRHPHPPHIYPHIIIYRACLVRHLSLSRPQKKQKNQNRKGWWSSWTGIWSAVVSVVLGPFYYMKTIRAAAQLADIRENSFTLATFLLFFFFFFGFSSFSFLFPKSNKLIRDYRDVNLNYPLEKLLMMASLELWILFSFSLFFSFYFIFSFALLLFLRSFQHSRLCLFGIHLAMIFHWDDSIIIAPQQRSTINSISRRLLFRVENKARVKNTKAIVCVCVCVCVCERELFRFLLLRLYTNISTAWPSFHFVSRRHYRTAITFIQITGWLGSSYLSCSHATWSNWTSLLLYVFFFLSCILTWLAYLLLLILWLVYYGWECALGRRRRETLSFLLLLLLLFFSPFVM